MPFHHIAKVVIIIVNLKILCNHKHTTQSFLYYLNATRDVMKRTELKLIATGEVYAEYIMSNITIHI